MISTFNLTKLDSLLCDFYTLAKIRITIFDENFNELTAYPRLVSPFCQIIRRDPAAQACCRRCDQAACAVASHRHMPYIYRCHSGLTEAIAPKAQEMLAENPEIRISEVHLPVALMIIIILLRYLKSCQECLQKNIGRLINRDSYRKSLR